MTNAGRKIRALPQTTAVGGESPNWSGEKPHSVCHAAFLSPGVSSYGRPGGGSRKARRCSIGLSTSVSVAHPFESGTAVTNRNWSKIMATIIAFPTADRHPVLSRRRGRVPKSVISLRDFKRREDEVNLLKHEIEERLNATQHLRNAIARICAETDALRLRYERAAHGHC